VLAETRIYARASIRGPVYGHDRVCQEV